MNTPKTNFQYEEFIDKTLLWNYSNANLESFFPIDVT